MLAGVGARGEEVEIKICPVRKLVGDGLRVEGWRGEVVVLHFACNGGATIWMQDAGVL